MCLGRDYHSNSVSREFIIFRLFFTSTLKLPQSSFAELGMVMKSFKGIFNNNKGKGKWGIYLGTLSSLSFKMIASSAKFKDNQLFVVNEDRWVKTDTNHALFLEESQAPNSQVYLLQNVSSAFLPDAQMQIAEIHHLPSWMFH